MAKPRGTVVMGAAGVVLAAVLLWSCSCGREEARPPTATTQRPWVCEACGHRFAAPMVAGVRKCPKCKKPAAVRSMVYQCGRCRRRFEAYRFLDCTGLESPQGPDGEPLTPGMHLKIKGGQWLDDEEMLGQIKCPHCGNADRSRMTPSFAQPDG